MWDDISKLVGLTMERVTADASVDFYEVGGRHFGLYHYRDCCESVDLVDIVGDVDDLVGSPIIMAEMVDGDAPPMEDDHVSDYTPESYTWTFVKVATAKGYVTFHWYGESNGYYSEVPTFRELDRWKE